MAETLPIRDTSTILVVDDDDDIRELLLDRLEFMGYNAMGARNGVEGLARIESDGPDLVMLDIQMPEMDGFGVLKGIADKNLDTTVIMITANGTIQKAVQAMQDGAFDFCLKPFQFADVEPRVNRALEQVRLRRENERLQQELEETQRRLIEEMQGELQVAHDMQMALLPEHPPQIEGMALSGLCKPAKQVGGDYYTYLDLNDRLGIVLADVSGKGMHAATVALRFNEMLRYEAEGREDIQDIMTGLDRALRGHIPIYMFVTCGIAVLDPHTRQLRFCTAACPEVYHFDATAHTARPLGLSGYPLGLPMQINCANRFEEISLTLGQGDLVVFASDGVEEARNEADELYGQARLRNTILTCGRQQISAKAVRDRIVDDVVCYMGRAPQTDDVSVVVLQAI